MLNVAYGFTYRTVDINDVIFNFTGVVIGLLAFFLASRLAVVAFGTQRIECGPLARIHEVFLRRDGRTFEVRQLAVCQTASSGVSGSDPAGSTEIRMPS